MTFSITVLRTLLRRISKPFSSLIFVPQHLPLHRTSNSHSVLDFLPAAARVALALAGPLFLALLVQGCKKTDSDPPTFNLTSPTSAISAVATDEVLIQGTAKDMVALSRVSAILANEFGQIASADSRELTGVEDEFTFFVQLGNRYSLTGNYTLTIQVEDASGNFSAKDVSVTLAELPKVVNAYALVEKSPTGTRQLHIFEPDWTSQPSHTFSLGDSVAGLWADGKESVIAVGEASTGLFRGYEYPDLGQLFQTTIGPAQNLYAITSLHSDGSSYYVGGQIQPYVRRFSGRGSSLGGLNSITQPVQALASTEEWLIAAVGIPTSNTHKIDAYDLDNGQLRQFQTIGHPIQALMTDETTIWAIGEQSGNIQLQSYTTQLVAGQQQVLQGKFRTVAANANFLYIGTDQGIYTMPWAGSVPQLAASGDTRALAYDEEHQTLITGGPQKLTVTTPLGTLLEDHSGLVNGTVEKIVILYNK